LELVVCREVSGAGAVLRPPVANARMDRGRQRAEAS